MAAGMIDAAPVADASRRNWVDRFAPDWFKPYARLARLDRPIGSWLLLWPCWWSSALAAIAAEQSFPNPWHLLLFAIGAVVMRGAGCTYNDIADRKFDAMVARTRLRPIPSGQVSVASACLFLAALSLVGLLVLLQFNAFAIATGLASLVVVALYPFAKRVTWWPQAVLGLAFSWGALMGWSAAFGRLDGPAFLLYGGSILWTIGYDTIYAHQDKEDDALIGVRSTARLFGAQTRPWLASFYVGAVALFGAAGILVDSGPVFFIGLAAVAGHFGWQILRLDIGDPDLCLRLFRSNRDAGAILFAGLAADALLRM